MATANPTHALPDAPTWVITQPITATAGAALALAALTLTVWAVRRATRDTPAAVTVAALAAAVCTAYTADTSWRFAAHNLGMTDLAERVIMFAAAELALFACALMARQNLRTTGAPGTPGVLVWAITGVQIIPAYSESGFVGGTVRAFIGPVCSALLWHLAMGLELRHTRPGALSAGTLATIGRDIRERLLSRLGVTTRDRTAEQITRDRATATAVRLAARRRRGPWAARRLAAAVTRSGVATDPNQRARLLAQLGARRGADQLATIELASPWQPEPEPAQPATLARITYEELHRLDPLDAVRRVHAAHPALTPAALASLCTEHGVVVSETQVRIAIRAGNPTALAAPHPDAHPHPDPDAFEAAAEEALALAAPAPALPPLPAGYASAPASASASAAAQTRSTVRATVPDAPAPESASDDASEPEPVHPTVESLLADARKFDAECIRVHGRTASLRRLQTRFSIGQPKAQRLRRALDEER